MANQDEQDRTISLADIREGRIPGGLQGVRWPDGSVECRFNIASDDHAQRTAAAGGDSRGVGAVLVGEPVDCDSCASKCNGGLTDEPNRGHTPSSG